MPVHEKNNYIEFPAKDMDAVKEFFVSVFDYSYPVVSSRFLVVIFTGRRVFKFPEYGS